MYHNQIRFASGMKGFSNTQDSINFIYYIYRISQKSIFITIKLNTLVKKYNTFSAQWLQDELFSI